MKSSKPDNKELRLVKAPQIIELAAGIDPRRFHTVVVNAHSDGEMTFKIPNDANIDGLLILLNRTLPSVYY